MDSSINYISHVNIELLKEALSNKRAVDFVINLRLQNYAEFPNHMKESIKEMITSGFKILQTNPYTEKNVKERLQYISKVIFNKDNETVWYNNFEDLYRTTTRVEIEYNDIKPYLYGKTILDLGCGSGRLSSRIMKDGYTCLLTDVIDYRIPEVRNAEFSLISNSDLIPFKDNCADTALVFHALHHIDKDLLPIFLQQLFQKAKRFIIKEDLFDIPTNLVNIKDKKGTDPFFYEFNSLPKKEQLLILTLSDLVSNSFLQRLPELNFPFTFHSVNEWINIFTQYNIEIEKVYIEGMRRDGSNFFGSCHGYFMLKSKN